MRINSIAGCNKYDKNKELNNKYEDKRKIQHKDQGISFADVLEQVRRNTCKMDISNKSR